MRTALVQAAWFVVAPEYLKAARFVLACVHYEFHITHRHHDHDVAVFGQVLTYGPEGLTVVASLNPDRVNRQQPSEQGQWQIIEPDL